jgi:hypothetical protein
VGEQSEHLWSLLKPFARLARYMTRAHWHDGFNLLLDLLTLSRLLTFPALLQQRRAANKKKLGTRLRLAALVFACH